MNLSSLWPSGKIRVIFSIIFWGLLISASSYAQINLYSRASNNYDALLTWYTNPGRTIPFVGTPGATHILNIGQGHTITVPSGTTVTFAGVVVHDAGASGTFVIGTNPNAAAAVTITGDIVINSSGAFQTGGDGTAVHSLTIGGNLTNDNIFNMRSAALDVVEVTFNGSANRTLSGAGNTFIFNRLTLNTTASSNLNVNSNILINSVLTFSANGLLVVGSSNNITLSGGASIAGNNASRYIQLDGSTNSGSQLIKTSNGATASWQITYPVGTETGGYTPVVFGTVGGTAPTNGSTIAIKAIYNSSVQGQLRRTFRIAIAGNAAATTFSGPQFNYNATLDLSQGDALANYSTIWHLSAASGSWTSPAGTAPGAGTFSVTTPTHNLVTGTYYYTIGTSTAYPNTWYTYQSGVWSDWQNWTLDPSGTTLVNGLNLPPQPGDEIVILNGSTITNDGDGQVASSTTIEGGAILDMVATTGNTLGTVSGAGILRIQGINLPSGNYTAFVTAGTGGTVEYYNTGGLLPTAQTTYNKLLLTNTTGSAITYITANNLTVNSDFGITQSGGGGTVTWQINNGTANRRTIILNGSLTVSTSGRIRASNSGQTGPHLLTIFGDLTNNGSIKFFDDTDAQLEDADYTSGAIYTTALKNNAVNVTFSGVANQLVTCNGQTDFYRLIVNKGSGQQAMLTVNSAAVANFRLFGPANLFSTGGVSNCALSIANGTLQLTGSITIPILIVNGSANVPNDIFSIPQTGALWLNGSGVSVTLTNNNAGNDDQRLTVDGLFRVTDGVFNSGFSRGIGSTNGGTILIEGGTTSIWQYRPVSGGSGIFSYIQTGGTVNVGTKGYNGTPTLSGVNDGVGGVTDQFARFSLAKASSSFQMSGGIINIGTPTTPTPAGANTPLAGGLDIQSANGNYNVTGGTINMYIPTGGTINFSIYSTAPLYNVNIYREGTTTARTAVLNSPLTVLNDLTILTGNSPTLNCANNDLTVGGNLVIQTGTTLTPGTNDIIFNGSGAQAWTHNGTITTLNDVVVNKSAGTLTLGGSGTFPPITGATTGLTLTSGTLNDGGKTITVTGALTNNAVHTGAGAIVYNNAGASTIGGSNGTFGNLTINTNATIATAGKQTITGTLRLIGAITTLNIGSNNLTVLGNIYSNATPGTAVAFTNTKRIQTNGLRNDGGLTRQSTSGVALLFPVGTSSILYTPVTINTTATTAGTVTVSPVANAHPNVTTPSESVQYFWRVTSSGFAGISTVSHNTYTYSNATRDAASATYRPARYDPNTFTWAYGPTYDATAGGGLTTIPNFNTGTGWTGIGTTQLDGEYTAGNLAAFGAVTVYYSRASAAWNLNTTWSNTAVGGPAAGSFPCSSCPVVIGDGGANNHTVTIDADGRNAGSLFLAPGSTLDCGTRVNLDFGVNTSGTGTLRIGSAVFPAGDFVNFLGAGGGTVEWYGATKTIPSTGSAPQNLNLITYRNLVISPNAAAQITLPDRNLTIYNNFTVSGAAANGQAVNNVTAPFTITINGNLNVVSGTLTFANNTVPNSTIYDITGNTTIDAGASINTPNNFASSHTIITSGSIINNGTFDLFGSVARATNLVFIGTNDASITGTNGSALTELNFVTVNKGSSQASTLAVDVAGTLNTLSNNWLTLQNGTLNFNVPSGSITLTNTANNTFTISSTARLKVQGGTVTIGNNNSNGSDLILAGAIEVAGGVLNIGNSANNTNNDIEYAAAGTPTIIVSSGNLIVNGAIRRATTTLSGALVYNQSGGTVTVEGRNCAVAPNNTRGIFEIESNAGSSFTFTGGTLNVRRSTGGASFADLYINPASSSVSSSGTIQFGMNANTFVSGTLSINVVPAVGNFSILNAGGTVQNIDMRSSELTSTGTLTIEANSTLRTNALNVNIGGDLVIAGTYNGTISGGNTTTFNGSGAQSGALTAGSTFQNITINKPAGTVTLTGNSSINNLNILSGILSVANTLDINGDIVNNSSQIGAGTIRLFGAATTHTITSSGGSFTNLSLGGAAATKRVTVVGDMTINGLLDFTASGTSRYLFIGSNQLSFGTTGTISNAGANRFIRTNGVSSDLGVLKNWPASATNTFVYAVGTRTNYTPVTVTLTTTAGGAGTMAVAPVDSQHPTASATGEQILNYYWIVRRANGLAYTATGSHVYQFPTGFIGGSGGTLRGAHLDVINLIGWTQPVGAISVAAPNTILTITNSLNTNLPGVNGIFHYTLGTVNTLPNPITPVYSRFSDNGGGNPSNVGNLIVGGNWNLATNWTLESDGTGAGLSQIPVGRPVVILPAARINMNIPGLSAFTSQINGLLYVPTTGHNLGTISGTGTMRAITSTLPAGTYTAFVSAAGGTIEYVAPMTMNNRSTYNNVSIIGTGSVIMTNTDLVLNGNMTIAAGATLDNSANNRNITLARDWINNGGSFTASAGTVIFNGSVAQNITGSTTLNNLTVAKTGGTVVLSGTATTTINGTATLTTGRVISSSTHPLVLGPSAGVSGGSINSFVNGPVRKTMAAGTSVTYPLGSISKNVYRPATIANTSAPDTWTLEYIGADPALSGYDYNTMNTANIGTVSRFEYWDISRAGATSADVTLTYDVGSYIPPNVGTVANLRVARWTGAQWDLPPGGGTFSQTGNNIAGTVTATSVTAFSPYTLASTDVGSPLPVTWVSFEGKRESNTIVLSWVTAQEINNDYFEVEKSIDGQTFYTIGTQPGSGNTSVSKRYTFVDAEVSPFYKYYYRIRQVDFNGDSDYSNVIMLQAVGEASQRWVVFPNPVKDKFTMMATDPIIDGSVNVVIFSPNGMTIFQGSGKLEDLSAQIEKTLHESSAGIYLIQINEGAYIENFRIVRY
ncbi:MAG: hypothetical protein JNM57_06325 [Cyclobacteriaceae bacterium]|nr:hypothetical protein [Cyclobacteriaceae bacterium]